MERDSELYLRDVVESDMERLFIWANDSTVRKNAFHTEEISRKEHVLWFHKVLLDPKEHLFILMDGEEAVGQIRLSCEGERAEIHYSIDSGKRGQGYGRAMCRLMIDKIRREYPEIKILTAKVKPLNAASIHCFQGNGFEEIYRQYELPIEHSVGGGMG